MINRIQIFDLAKASYNILPDYPWAKHPNYAVLRHHNNGKWFGLIMDISKNKLNLVGNEKIDILNLKAPKEFIGPLRKKKGIYPAYHMDKSNWIIINLSEIDNLHEIQDLIAESFALTS